MKACVIVKDMVHLLLLYSFMSWLPGLLAVYKLKLSDAETLLLQAPQHPMYKVHGDTMLAMYELCRVES